MPDYLNEMWFGEWVALQRIEVKGDTQEQCAARVQEYYDAHPLPSGKILTFSRSSWSKMEGNRVHRQVREATCLHASIGLQLPLQTCRSVAGYRPVGKVAEDRSHKLGRGIRLARTACGIDPKIIAQAMGVSEERYLSWESGRAVPDALQIEQLALYMSVPLPDLYSCDPGRRSVMAASEGRVDQLLLELRALTDALKQQPPPADELPSGRPVRRRAASSQMAAAAL